MCHPYLSWDDPIYEATTLTLMYGPIRSTKFTCARRYAKASQSYASFNEKFYYSESAWFFLSDTASRDGRMNANDSSILTQGVRNRSTVPIVAREPTSLLWIHSLALKPAAWKDTTLFIWARQKEVQAHTLSDLTRKYFRLSFMPVILVTRYSFIC